MKVKKGQVSLAFRLWVLATRLRLALPGALGDRRLGRPGRRRWPSGGAPSPRIPRSRPPGSPTSTSTSAPATNSSGTVL